MQQTRRSFLETAAGAAAALALPGCTTPGFDLGAPLGAVTKAHFVKPGEKLIAKAEIVKVRGNKYFVWVKTRNDTQEVFRAKFIMVSWGEE